MNLFKGNIAIIGAGSGGSALLSVILHDNNITIAGITDSDPDAPGLQLARRHGIPIAGHFRELLEKRPDIVVNVTGDEGLISEIMRMKAPETEVIDGRRMLFVCSLLEKSLHAQGEVKRLLEETKELYRIGVSLTSADSLEEALETLLSEALRTVRAPAGSIALYNETDDTLTLKALQGFSPAFSRVSRWTRRDGGMTDHILSKRVPTVIPDTEKHSFIDNQVLLNEGARSIVAVPLFANDRVVGILYIDDFTVRDWSQKEVEFLTLLGIQAAFAIEKFRLISAISETRSYLENVLDTTADIVITTDTGRRIVEFNKGASRVLGYTKEEMTGREVEELWVRPEERGEIMAILERDGYVAGYETQLKAKDGRPIDVSLTLTILKDSDGRMLGTVGISKDITEKKKLERAIEERNAELHELNEKLEEKVFERTKEIERANRELERSNKLKSQFIATMSHELRTPLNSILGFSELLLDDVYGALEEKQKRHVQNIYNSGSHLLQLINNILDIAKIESGKMELHYESFSLAHAVAEVETVIRSLADRKKQEMRVRIPGDLPPVKADRVKFKQILYNLLSNAVKFTPEGGAITLEASVVGGSGLPPFAHTLEVFSEKAEFLVFSIEDTGIGIRAEDRERIFSEFEQGDSSYSRKYEGTGLGLALTKRLVALHGGEIAVESEENVGSRFTFIIPLFDGVVAGEPLRRPFRPVEEFPAQDVEVVKSKRSKSPLILVVEDDPSTSEVLTLYLAQAGYRIAHAYSGIEAVHRIKELKPFAVLLDVMLPEKDGWEILQEVKSDPETKDIPVIISSVIDNRELGFALGASDYLVKPVDRTTLLKKLQELSFDTKKVRKSVTILCIDDNQEVLELLTSILEPAGYNVITSGSGQEGIDKAASCKPDLIILDLMMPEVDGFEVVQKLKDSPVTDDIPIFILTAKDLSVEDRLRLAGKIESFVQKSHFTKEDLLEYIKDLEVTYPARAGFLDEVSGLFDHSYFQIRLAQEVSRAKRYRNTFTTLIIDLDNFTEYIRVHGITRANICIRKVADILRKGLRGSDTVVRCGIDEFGVVLTNTPKESAEAVAKRFLAYIEGYPFFGEEAMPQGCITGSAAVVNYPQDASTPEEIIFKAHQILRKVKENGGKKVGMYER
ncbi:MAG: response regulator [Alphaproteobacteria bacterium]|uniref:histidine kinase n=1 Tax=Candidatus Nitrobium versatile TaxID=2884831 RepID=A0A953SEY2_9BACT|nr:response regulator [Candidatus Nitrobium versatile]